MKFISRLLLPLVVALMCLASASPLMAQGSKTWLPEFNPDQHVYIDSHLENHSSKPLSLPNLPAEIERAQKLHKLKIYVVATEQGSDVSQGPKAAANKLDELVLKWRNQPNFPTDDYLIVLWVRYHDDPARGSVAANGGNRLRAYGMTADHFGSSSGPVIPTLKQHMRERPELALTTIIRNVNSEVTSAIEAQESAAAREEAMKALPGILLKWGSILAGLALCFFVSLRFFKARSRMREKLNRFENNLDRVTEFLEQLKKKHSKFLKAQADWETRFKGASLTKLRAGLTAYSELLAIAAGGAKRKTEVRKAAGSFWFPRIQGSLDAIKLLTEVDITISSREIELEMATLFGGLTINKVVAPGQFFDDARVLNTTAEAALAEIENKLALIDTTFTNVGALVTWCRDQRAGFEKEKLSLAPYQDDIDQLAQSLDTFKRDADRDPISFVLEAPALNEQAASVKARIEAALALAKELETGTQALARLVREIEQLRQTQVDYNFPGCEQTVLAGCYSFKGEDGDPDDEVREANGFLMKAFDLLNAGNHEQARAALEAAKLKRDDASAVIQAVFKAKNAVEENGQLVATTKDLLKSELSNAQAALAKLKSEFLPVNFPEAEGQYSDASVTLDGTTKFYAVVKTAYDRQNYILASRLLAELLDGIQNARQDCTAIQDQLELLRKQRKQSRILVFQARKHFDGLSPKVSKEHRFTTSATVDQRLDAAGAELTTLETIVPNATADWVDAYTRATALKQELSDIESACDNERSLYDEAFALIDSLPADVEDAFLAINQRTLQPARDAHASAAGELEKLARLVDVPKSNWQEIKDQATAAHLLCQLCRKLAKADDAQAHTAAVNLAYCKVRSRRFARRTHRYLTEANRLYSLASAAYAARDWQKALKLSSAAYKEFNKYDRQLKRRNATLVVKGSPGGSSSAPPSASGSHTSGDDGFSTGIAIAIGMSMGSGNPAPSSSGGSSSSPSSTPSYTPSYTPSTPSYSSDTGGGGFSVDTGGGGFSGGSGGGDY